MTSFDFWFAGIWIVSGIIEYSLILYAGRICDGHQRRAHHAFAIMHLLIAPIAALILAFMWLSEDEFFEKPLVTERKKQA